MGAGTRSLTSRTRAGHAADAPFVTASPIAHAVQRRLPTGRKQSANWGERSGHSNADTHPPPPPRRSRWSGAPRGRLPEARAGHLPPVGWAAATCPAGLSPWSSGAGAWLPWTASFPGRPGPGKVKGSPQRNFHVQARQGPPPTPGRPGLTHSDTVPCQPPTPAEGRGRAPRTALRPSTPDTARTSRLSLPGRLPVQTTGCPAQVRPLGLPTGSTLPVWPGVVYRGPAWPGMVYRGPAWPSVPWCGPRGPAWCALHVGTV